MILSCSRRTDIPAYYSEWIYKRLCEGYFFRYNKRNNIYEKVMITPDVIDCIVFWTKNPKPLLPYLKNLENMGYSYYFQFTLTPYQSDIESGLKNKREILNTFIELSELIGSERVVWRYDPVLINDKYTIEFHKKAFKQLAVKLKGYTKECIFSFVDEVANNNTYFRSLTQAEMVEIAKSFSDTAKENGMLISTCCEAINFEEYDISNASCIDKNKIENIIGRRITAKKDRSQRGHCRCIESIDVGEYFSCKNNCQYCYAGGYNYNLCCENYKKSNPSSPLLIGEPDNSIKIKRIKPQSFICNEQISMF